MPSLFDPHLRALRRDRAARQGPALFLHERAFEDILDRLAMMGRRFERALLLGCPDPEWRVRLEIVADCVDGVDPGPLFAAALGESPIREEELDVAPASYDLIVAIGTLDTVDDLPDVFLRLSFALRSDGLLIGAMAGGDTLPALRSAMLEADRASGGARPRAHPRIAAAALAPLLERAGLLRPVIDVDRVRISYASLDRLVSDLRAMGATSVLRDRPRDGANRSFRRTASVAFAALGNGGKTLETFEILHFAGWRGAA